MAAAACIVLNPFEMLYAQHRALVYGTALRVLHDPNEAEDIVQIIFLRVYSRPGRFRGENVAGWLKTMAKNAAIDRFRRLRLERLHGERFEFAAAESVEDAALRGMENRGVREALADLSDAQRVPLTAIYFGGYSHRAIARTTNVPLGTVKTRVRTGLARLRSAVATSR